MQEQLNTVWDCGQWQTWRQQQQQKRLTKNLTETRNYIGVLSRSNTIQLSDMDMWGAMAYGNECISVILGMFPDNHTLYTRIFNPSVKITFLVHEDMREIFMVF